MREPGVSWTSSDEPSAALEPVWPSGDEEVGDADEGEVHVRQAAHISKPGYRACHDQPPFVSPRCRASTGASTTSAVEADGRGAGQQAGPVRALALGLSDAGSQLGFHVAQQPSMAKTPVYFGRIAIHGTGA